MSAGRMRETVGERQEGRNEAAGDTQADKSGSAFAIWPSKMSRPTLRHAKIVELPYESSTGRLFVIINRPVAPNQGGDFPAEVLDPGEVAAIIAGCSARSASGIRNRAMLTMLYRSGLRISELLAIRPADVNLASRSIRLLDTKTGGPQTRGFHPAADDAVARWIDKRRQLGIRSGPLFCKLDGGPLYPQYVRLLLKRLAAKAGIERRVHPHGLRHTFAAELEASGVPVSVISKLLGHHSIATTSRYLDHLTNRQAVAALAAVELPPLASGGAE